MPSRTPDPSTMGMPKIGDDSKSIIAFTSSQRLSEGRRASAEESRASGLPRRRADTLSVFVRWRWWRGAHRRPRDVRLRLLRRVGGPVLRRVLARHHRRTESVPQSAGAVAVAEGPGAAAAERSRPGRAPRWSASAGAADSLGGAGVDSSMAGAAGLRRLRKTATTATAPMMVATPIITDRDGNRVRCALALKSRAPPLDSRDSHDDVADALAKPCRLDGMTFNVAATDSVTGRSSTVARGGSSCSTGAARACPARTTGRCLRRDPRHGPASRPVRKPRR